MAWQARVDAVQLDISDTDNVYVTISFYDDVADSAGANPPFVRQLKFAVNASPASMQAAVLAAGQAARAASNRRTTLLAAAPVGTLIAIP
jgi:hypothetical protein